jgi:uncharacterized protein YciI
MYFLHVNLTQKPGRLDAQRDAHVTWVKKYVDNGVFLLASAKTNGLGGVIIAYGVAREMIREIIAQDPYVIHDLVEYQIIDVEVKMTQPELAFLHDA